MKSILVPVDFSDAANTAARYAAALANDFSAKIHLLNVFHIPNPLQTLPLELVVTMDELEDATHSQLKKLGEQLYPLLNDTSLLTFSSRNGNSTKEILDHGTFIHADLIVMGTKGSGMIRDKLIGSTSEAIVRHSNLPTLLVPEQCLFSPIHTAVYTVSDPNVCTDKESEILHSLYRCYQTHFDIVHLPQQNKPMEAEAIINRLETTLLGLPHDYHFPIAEDVAKGIEAYTHVNPIDLLILTKHFHNYFGRLRGNDTVQKIIRNSNTPVLCFH